MRGIFFVFGFSVLVLTIGNGQQVRYTTVNGQYYPYPVSDCGDTLIIANLDDVSITEPRLFDNEADRALYRRYKRYALKVYPYAVEAVKLFRELEVATQDYANKHRKRYIKALHKELKTEFTDQLKKLTKTQGMILMKMIERELDQNTYDLVKDLKGGFTATYWSTIASMYGHQLKEGYIEGKDPILDMVLSDLDVSYQVPLSFRSHFEGGNQPFKVKKRWERKAEQNKVDRLVEDFLDDQAELPVEFEEDLLDHENE